MAFTSETQVQPIVSYAFYNLSQQRSDQGAGSLAHWSSFCTMLVSWPPAFHCKYTRLRESSRTRHPWSMMNCVVSLCLFMQIKSIPHSHGESNNTVMDRGSLVRALCLERRKEQEQVFRPYAPWRRLQADCVLAVWPQLSYPGRHSNIPLNKSHPARKIYILVYLALLTHK